MRSTHLVHGILEIAALLLAGVVVMVVVWLPTIVIAQRGHHLPLSLLFLVTVMGTAHPLVRHGLVVALGRLRRGPGEPPAGHLSKDVELGLGCVRTELAHGRGPVRGNARARGGL